MCKLNSLCGCLSLKTGCMVTTGYTILFGLTGLAYGVWGLNGGLAIEMKAAKTRSEDEGFRYEGLESIIRKSLGLAKVVYIIVMVLFAIWIVTGILILVAVTKKRRSFLMPWIAMTSFLTGLLIVGTIQLTRYPATDLSYLLRLLIFGILIPGNIYGLCGVVSHYQNRCQEGKELTGKDQFAYKTCPEEVSGIETTAIYKF